MATLAIDIGATKFAIGVVEPTLEISHRREIPATELWGGLSAILQEIATDRSLSITRVGIGSAGPINTQAGEISPVNIPTWRSYPIVGKVQEIFPQAEMKLVGDAVALAIAEHAVGAGSGSVNMLGMVVSTGIGGGIIVDGKPIEGDFGNAGYFGHTVVGDYDGGCNCGRVGCVESYSSGISMVRYAEKNGWKGQDFIALADSARNGDAIAINAINFGIEHLVKAIINIAQIFDLHTVVVGGGVAEAGEIYWKPLKSALVAHSTSLNLVQPIKLLPAQLQRDAGLIGAAMVVGLE